MLCLLDQATCLLLQLVFLALYFEVIKSCRGSQVPTIQLPWLNLTHDIAAGVWPTCDGKLKCEFIRCLNGDLGCFRWGAPRDSCWWLAVVWIEDTVALWGKAGSRLACPRQVSASSAEHWDCKPHFSLSVEWGQREDALLEAGFLCG